MTQRRAVALLLLTLLAVTGCSGQSQGGNADPGQVDSTEAPANGACRVLSPEDVAQPTNATATVACSEAHTAQTFTVGELPAEFDDASYDDSDLSAFAYETCSKKFAKFIGADESLVLRTVLSWAWFRPSEKAWDKGARWYRCDVVGGGTDSGAYRDLPDNAKGLLLGRHDDRWLACANGPSVAEGEKVACSEDHTWRAVTTIKLGEPGDDYPGDRVAESRTRSFCQESVQAWLNYPASFKFGFTYFHQAEWEAGNRRSVCWAETDE